jgi:hypothetical protein
MMRQLILGICVGSFLFPAISAEETKPVTDAGGIWRASVPDAWKVQPNGAMTLCSSPDGRVNVVIFAEARRPIALDQWAETVVTDLQKQIPNFKVSGKQSLPVAGQEGLLTRAQSETQGIQMHMDCVLVQGAKHQIMVSCNCPENDFKANQLTFGKILASLQIAGEPVSTVPDSDTTPGRHGPADETAGKPTAPTGKGSAALEQVQWESYVSKHFTFTIRKPVGWVVEDGFQAEPTMWAFSVTHPQGLYQVSQVHGTTPAGQDAEAVLRAILADYRKKTKAVDLAPTIKTKTVGKKTIYLFDGTYTSPADQKRQFHTLVSVGDGLTLNQRIEAPDGQLEKIAPVLLQVLANQRVAKNVFTFDEGGQAAKAAQANPPPAPPPVELTPRKLAAGWGTYAAPADWKQVDLGKGQVIACDPAEQIIFVAANADFITPQFNLVRVPGVLVSKFLTPHEALAFACTEQGHGKDFKFEVRKRDDLVAQLRAGLTGGRPCAVEDFVYTFDKKGKAYKGLSLGYTIGTYTDSNWGLGHLTVWAPADRFDALIPTLGRIMLSYELNGEKVGGYIAEGIRRYQAGIAQLSRTIAANSEQMRRENLQLHMERGRVQDYTSYLTTRMIMGEYDYLAGASGYVRGDASGLYTADGVKITSEPYGESITRGMQEINSRPLFEAVRP